MARFNWLVPLQEKYLHVQEVLWAFSDFADLNKTFRSKRVDKDIFTKKAVVNQKPVSGYWFILEKGIVEKLPESRYSRMDQAEFVEDEL